jgi:hypothetical protein
MHRAYASRYRAVAASSALRGEMELLEPELEGAEPCDVWRSPLGLFALIFLARVLGHSFSGTPESPHPFVFTFPVCFAHAGIAA